MQKTAQKRTLRDRIRDFGDEGDRGILSKIKEVTNIGGIASENFFEPEFKQLMDDLRLKTDDPVRAIVSGSQIGEAEAPSDGLSLKDLLKDAKSAINRREYMRAVALLGKFHKRMFDVTNILGSFKNNIDSVHEKFLFQHLDDEHKQHLRDLKQKFSESQYPLIKEASILDFLTNIGTERGRALSAWEKRYPHKVKELKKETESLLARSEHLLSVTLSVLKNMAKFRASRKVDDYIKASEKIIDTYKIYDAKFKVYYETFVKNFLEKPELLGSVQTDTSSKPEELNQIEVGKNPLVSITPPGVVNQPGPGFGSDMTQPVQTLPMLSTPPMTPPQAPNSGAFHDTNKTPTPNMSSGVTTPPSIPNLQPPQNLSKTMDSAVSEQAQSTTPVTLKSPVYRAAHKKFVASLEALANESPSFLKTHICRYAKSIEKNDPKTAIQLFKIAQSIKV